MREQLVHANVAMATEISNIQQGINDNMNILIDKICNIIEKPKPSRFVHVTLIPPSVLQLQLIELSLTSVTNLINILSEMKSVHINPVTLLKKYIPFIDWEDIISESELLNVKERTKTANQTLNSMAGGMTPPGGGMI